MSDAVSLPFVVTWANKPEFVGMPEDNFNAKFGFAYRLGSKTKAQGGLTKKN